MRNNQPKSFKVAVNNIELNVYEWGGEGDPIVFVHATGFHARLWDKIINALGNRHVLAIDQRNHGLSDNTPPPYTWGLYGDDFTALVEKLDLQNITAIGHSMGGHVVIDVASRLPKRFKQILAIDPVVFAPNGFDPGTIQGMDSPVAYRRNEWSSAEEMFDRFKTREPFSDWDLDVLHDYCEYGLVAADNGEGFHLACPPANEAGIYQCTGNKEILDKLENIEAPVKILRARDRTPEDKPFDFRPSATWSALVNQIPNATERFLASHSHFIPMEDPELVIEEVLKLIGN